MCIRDSPGNPLAPAVFEPCIDPGVGASAKEEVEEVLAAVPEQHVSHAAREGNEVTSCRVDLQRHPDVGSETG
eukprot:670027-Hanusia_phi.AAC.1